MGHFIVSQEVKLFMMNLQNQCCQFFVGQNFLIKRVDVFYKWLSHLLPRGS